MQTSQIYDSSDTICAICTPQGAGAIAVIRISGKDAFSIADTIWHGSPLAKADSHTAHLGNIIDPATGDVLDQALATVFRAPGTFTGDDIVEFGIHGSRWIQHRLIDLLIRQGCRLALPGEYTRRAFSAGKMDLSEAEAVADLIAASSRASHRLAMNQMRGKYSRQLNSLREELIHIASLLELELDFSEEDVEFADRSHLLSLAENLHSELSRLGNSFSTGAAIKDGIPVAIIGPTNAGKSSLLNALIGDDRAIVSDIHGTTRDIVEDTLEIGPYLIRFKDTAGLRKTTDTIESLGIERSLNAAKTARIVLYLIDPTASPASEPEIAGDTRIIYIINKTDIATADQLERARSLVSKIAVPESFSLELSAKQSINIDRLKNLIAQIIEKDTDNDEDSIIVTNARHAAAFRAAAESTAAVIHGLSTSLPPDLIAEHLRETLHHLATITGEITTPTILQSIFDHFCIGK